MRFARLAASAAVLLCLFSATGATQDSATLDEWTAVGNPNAGGIAVLIQPGLGSFEKLLVTDETGEMLSQTDWDVASPILQNYVLAPGTYELVFGPYQPVKVSIEAGQQVYVEALGGAVPQVSYEPTEALRSAFGELVGKGYADLIEPHQLDPPNDFLQFGWYPDPWPPRDN